MSNSIGSPSESMGDDISLMESVSTASISIKESEAKVSMLHRSAEKRFGLSKLRTRYQVLVC